MKEKSSGAVGSVHPSAAYSRNRTKSQKAVQKHKHLTDDEKASIIVCYGEGMSNRQNASLHGVGRRQVNALIQRYNAGEPLARRSGSGRPRITTSHQDKKVILDIKRNPKLCARSILSNNPGIKASESTICRRIKESGEFGSFFTVKKPVITEINRIKRLKWAREHKNWTNEQWRQVLWTDESPFELRNECVRRVWRLRSQRNHVVNFTPTKKYQPKIMVWGAFSYGGVGRLHWIQDIMTKEIYHDILHEQMLPSKDMLFGDRPYIFQQDNDPKHTAKINKQ